MAEASHPKPVHERVEDALREIGTLVCAFTPLDAAVIDEPQRRATFLLFFLPLGALLFSLA